NASGVDKVFAATNKDWNNRETRILFIPATPDKYGRVYFGYQLEEGFQNVGGMNDQGLWYDGASLPSRSDIENHYNKPRVKGELCEKALEECATVEEVIQLYEYYYTPHWQGHSMWADRFGNSVIIEYGEKDVVFIRKEQGFQVMTNFYISDTDNPRWYNCHRFNAITEIMERAGSLNVDVMTEALDASHKEGLTPTLFSNVYDLKNGEIHLYHFHCYDEVVRLDLAKELEKGDQYLEIPQLFHGIRLKAPASEQLVDGADVEIMWSGAAGVYEIYCSEDKLFTEAEPVVVMNHPQSGSSLLGLSSLLILGVLTGLSGRLRKRLPLMLLVGSLFLGGCAGCSKIFISPQFPHVIDGSVVVEQLKPGTTYYWKVVALGDNGINSESVVQTFTTAT
ncbi:MAG: hypothetical protein KAS82_10975, partial [Bacteroidales bacterium]|nr:hypothetical protein [Bacteroidales bacterium]